jgi:hypothetical protein
MDALKLLKNIQQMTIADVWPNRPITWVSASYTLQECLQANIFVRNADLLQLFKTTRVLSFPVVDTITNACIGVVDIMDVALYIVGSDSKVDLTYEASFPSLNYITTQVLSSLEFNGKKFLEETNVQQVIGT